MLLLFLLLNFQLVKLSAVERGATLLLRHMALLFIPVAVGLIAYLEPFTQSLGVIMLNVLLGIALILLIVGQLFQRLNRRITSYNVCYTKLLRGGFQAS